jgi:type IX secretion system PorP/SprF family membrane protein
MKRIILISLILVAIQLKEIQAQQDAFYSHYIFNELVSNPAYAGSKEMLSVGMLYRAQWVDFEGSPKTFTVGVHSPLKNKNMALGGSIIQDKITVFSNTTLSFMYAYHIPFNKKIKLSVGLQGSLLFERVNLNELDAFNSNNPDQAFLDINKKSFHPNVGTGAYLYGKNFSFGVGIPHLIMGKWINSNERNINQVNHYFVTGSYTADINHIFKLMPTVAMRFTENAPIQFEGNLNAILYDRLMLGAGFRSDKSAIFMVNYFHLFNNGVRTNEFRFGYAYDLAWQPLRSNSMGSHELILTFGLSRKNERHISPRFF